MALSAQNDSGQSGAEDTNMVKQQDIINELRNKHDSGIGIDSAMQFEILNGMNLGTGVSAPISMTHSSPNSEESGIKMMDLQLVTNGYDKENNFAKKHIAYHLLSNLLDDEIIEDAKNEPPSSRPETNEVFDGVGSWPASMSSLSSSFSLNLDLNDVSNQASFSNRSIHEIWSPNPSPKGSYPSTPSDESVPYFPSSHDNRDSPFSNRSPVDILAGRSVGSPMLASPCSLPSEQSILQHHSRRDTSPFFNSKFSSIDVVNHNNNIISNGVLNGHAYDNGTPQKQNMRAIRSLQFMDPGIEADHNGQDCDILEYVPTSFNCDDNAARHDHKGRKHQVHFEEKPRNGIIVKPHNGQFLVSKDEMMTAAKRLGSGLDECLDQLRNLEREYRRAEQELSRIYPSRRRSSSTAGSYHNRVPSNPTRVDKMIFEQLKVHDKVESLIGRIERLGRTPLHSNVGVALDRWLACVRELQNLRKDEISNSPGSHGGSYGSKSYDDRDLLALANCIRDLVSHTRAARTTVWCATQMLHAEEYWTIRPSESCGSLERHSDHLSEKS